MAKLLIHIFLGFKKPMLNKNLKFIYTALFLFFALSQKAQAGFLDDAGLSEDCTAQGRCSLGDIVAGFIGLIQLLLGGIAAIALVFLVWGGVQWVWSGGNADKVKRGKDIFFNTTAALVLAFGSYMITSFFINDVLLGGNTGGEYDKYRVQSEEPASGECIAKDIGESCNAPLQYYVCSGPEFGESCQEGCDVLNSVIRDELVANNLIFDCKDRTGYANPAFREHLCSGGNDRVCILFHAGGTAVSLDEVSSNQAYADVMTWNLPWQQ